MFVEKCPVKDYVSKSSVYRQHGEQASIRRSLEHSENVVTHAGLLKIDISCLQGLILCIYDDLRLFSNYCS